MNKIIKCAIVLVVICAFLTGCGGENLLKDSSVINYRFNETAKFDNFNITPMIIFQMEISENDILKPKRGNAFVSVRFDIENISDEDVVITSLGMFKAYADGYAVEISVTGSTAFTSAYEEIVVDGVLKSGDKKTGWLTVEVPEEWQELSIFVKSSTLSNDYVRFTYDK